MAKACAYLCRQCCFIDGFREFGEIFASDRGRFTLAPSLGANIQINFVSPETRMILANVTHVHVRYMSSVRPSVDCLSSVCLWSVVCNVRAPYSGD